MVLAENQSASKFLNGHNKMKCDIFRNPKGMIQVNNVGGDKKYLVNI